MDRIVVDANTVARELNKNKVKGHNADLYPEYTDYIPHLYKSLYLPSYVHGYSIAIEYMRNWFVSKFPKDPNSPTGSVFKTIYINGSHVLDNWKFWNNYNIKREKPMLAIVPSLAPEWDRENVDLYVGDRSIMLKRSRYQDSFIKDYRNKVFLYVNFKEMELNFTFRIRLNTRAQQLDYYNMMNLAFRVGTTQKDDISADFEIPYDVMYQIAKDAHFDVDEENKLVRDIPAFLQYLNQHSSAPIIYKMRAINQKPEFFVRARSLHTHISTRDQISIDDGEKDGKLDTNFHVEMTAQLHMPVPYFYAYMNQIPMNETLFVTEPKPSLGIYSIVNDEIKPENELGWPSIAVTSYYAEKGDETICIKSLFDSPTWPVTKVLNYNFNLGISPEAFIDVKVYKDELLGGRAVNFHMDYRHLNIVLGDTIEKDQMFEIAIYADMKYVNSTLATIENYYTRVNSNTTPIYTDKK